MKVYAATSGSYSDFRVRHLFVNEEDAESYANKMDEGSWDEYELREGPVERRVKYTLTWEPKKKDRDGGNMYLPNPWMDKEDQDYFGDSRVTADWIQRVQGGRYNAETVDLLRVVGWSKQDVLKVYSDERARYKAREEGIS